MYIEERREEAIAAGINEGTPAVRDVRHQDDNPSGSLNKCWRRWNNDKLRTAKALFHVYRQGKSSTRS